MASRLVSEEEGKNYLVGSAIYWERELGIENKDESRPSVQQNTKPQPSSYQFNKSYLPPASTTETRDPMCNPPRG